MVVFLNVEILLHSFTSDRQITVSQCSPVNSMSVIGCLDLLHTILKSASILVSFMCMLYHNFYCTFVLLSPFEKKTFLVYLYCCYNDIGCQVTAISSF
jgi:hypothetical protein